MLPSFVIGLREGLEAAIVVSIIASFLRRNGASLKAMSVGVIAGVLLSIAVGVVLHLVEESLPTQAKEGMEAVIAAIAVVFVTAMLLWMRTHARSMKGTLEAAAGEALRRGTTTALALMALFAVLREGFETAVFLLATVQSADGAPTALVGAVLGIGAAVALGWAMYAGAVHLNMQRFFRVTAVFIIFVAAGLVLATVRSSHEAGWLTAGQQTTVDLSWLAPPGSIRSALITGVLNVPRDPRRLESLAWLTYLIPMLAYTFWPRVLMPGPERQQRLRVSVAGVSLAAAVALIVLVQVPSPHVPAAVPLEGGGSATLSTSGDGSTVEVRGQRLDLGGQHSSNVAGIDSTYHVSHAAGDLPATLTADELIAVNGGRTPIGLSLGRTPGPFTARWTDDTTLTAQVRDGGLVFARLDGKVVLSYSGGGLSSPRVLSQEDGWNVDPGYVARVSSEIAATDRTASERAVWKWWLPVLLTIAAAWLLVKSARVRATDKRGTINRVPDTVAHDQAPGEARLTH